MDKLLFIFNPHAGKGRVHLHLAELINTFTRVGQVVTAYPTQGPGDAVQAARRLAPHYDRLVVWGGDGTLHEVINGLMSLPAEHRPPLGYIPAGTTNDFAQNLALPRRLDAKAALAATGAARWIDVGRLEEDYFVYVAAFGAFTNVAYDTPQQFKNVLGRLAYVLRGVTELGNVKGYHLKLTHDGGELEGEFLYGMVSNTVSVGGFIGLPAQEVALDDGQLEVLLIPMPKTMAELNAMILGLATQTYSEETGIIGFHTGQLVMACDEPVPFTLDGENGGEHALSRIAAIQQAVPVVFGA